MREGLGSCRHNCIYVLLPRRALTKHRDAAEDVVRDAPYVALLWLILEQHVDEFGRDSCEPSRLVLREHERRLALTVVRKCILVAAARGDEALCDRVLQRGHPRVRELLAARRRLVAPGLGIGRVALVLHELGHKLEVESRPDGGCNGEQATRGFRQRLEGAEQKGRVGAA